MSETLDFIREFDRYCERNNISDEDTPKAFEAFLREFDEMPDIKGRPLSPTHSLEEHD